MNEALRKYLESIGLRTDASDVDAWKFYSRLAGSEQESARALKEGRTPPGEGQGTGNQDPEGGQRRASEPPADPPADPADAARAAVREERERVRSIRSHAQEHGVPDRLMQRALDRGWSLEDYTERAEELEEIRSGNQDDGDDPAIDWSGGFAVRGFDREASAQALAAGVMHRSGASEQVIGCEAAADFHGPVRRTLTEQDAERGDRFATDSLVDLCRSALRIDGKQVPHNRHEMIRAALSTPALSFAFTTSIHARVLAGYQEAEDTSDWVETEDVSNFQTQERGSLGKTAALEKLPRGQTAQHATISDSKEEYKIARYAKQIAADEQDFIDDNMDFIQRTPVEMGEAARRLRPDLVYSILLANPNMRDGKALFHNDHDNNGTAAFGKDNLELAVVAIGQQTEDDVRLNLRPRYLIVPGDLEWTARELLTSTQLMIASGEDATTVRGKRNGIADLNLQLRSEGRIDAAGVTDPASGTALTGSASTWFLAGTRRTIIVGYLAGTGRRPMVRRYTLDKGAYGMGWDIKLDIGAKALDWRGLRRGNV